MLAYNYREGVVDVRVINFEDEPIKHRAIRDVLESCRITDIDNVRNLEDGVAMYKEAISAGNPYDLIITDMWYPAMQGGQEEKSGEKLIEIAVSEKWNTPIITCSSQNYSYPEAYGSLYYSENEDWEGKLRGYINKLK